MIGIARPEVEGASPLPRAIAPARDRRCSAACRSRRRADWSCCRRRQPRRYPGRRKPQRRDLDVVLGAGMGWSGHLPAFDHRPSPGGNWPFLGGGLYWLGHGRGLQLWKGADPTAFGARAVSLIATEEASTPHARSERLDHKRLAASNLAQRRCWPPLRLTRRPKLSRQNIAGMHS